MILAPSFDADNICIIIEIIMSTFHPLHVHINKGFYSCKQTSKKSNIKHTSVGVVAPGMYRAWPSATSLRIPCLHQMYVEYIEIRGSSKKILVKGTIGKLATNAHSNIPDLSK